MKWEALWTTDGLNLILDWCSLLGEVSIEPYFVCLVVADLAEVRPICCLD